MEPFRKAFIYVCGVFAGTLAETDEGYSFAYDEAYLTMPDAPAVSLTLPLSKEVYKSKTLTAAKKMIDRILAMVPVFLTMCDESFLPTDMKEGLKNLITDRCGRLSPAKPA